MCPSYVLHGVDDLARADLVRLGVNPVESGFAAICVDPSGQRSVQAIGREAESLMRGLATGVAVEGQDDLLATLVLAGLVEVEHPEHGWLTGPDATRLVAGDPPSSASAGPGSRLARAAFEHARLLGIDDPVELAARLYFFNRLPISRRWRDRWPDEAAILSDLGVAQADAFPGLSRIGGVERSWLAWGMVGERQTGHPFKLYVSPGPQCLGDCLSVVRGLAGTGFYAIKIGGDVSGLLRPDKCVLYFNDKAALDLVAGELATGLAGLDGHGVPFTAWRDTTGLLSWALDPPPEVALIGRFSDSSWRIWVCNRLAVALVASKRLAVEEAWLFARANLRLAGVDTRLWAPLEAVS